MLCWDKISVCHRESKYFYKRTREIPILREVSGYAPSNCLLAIMGSSGGGKTTLLGALAGKIKTKKGTVMFNNEIVEDSKIKYFSGYMYQDDIFTDSLTVEEHLEFMAALKLGINKKERPNSINKLLSDLSLNSVKQTVLRVLSGGEKRRVALATELICDPSILFCDEPTTGLDSHSAITLIKILNNLKCRGKIIITTVHQPSSQVFEYFTHVTLLSHGNLIYHGARQNMSLFFDRVNLKCPENYNLADFYIKCVSTKENEQMLSKMFRSELNLTNGIHVENSSFTKKVEKLKTKRILRILSELYWLLWRATIDTKRSVSRHAYGIGFCALTALLVGMAYSASSTRDTYNVQNIQGVLFVISSEMIFTQMYDVIYTFPAEYAISQREKSVYSSFPYFVSKIILMVPLNILKPLLFLILVHAFFSFIRNTATFLKILVVLVFSSLAASSLGLCMSGVFHSLDSMEFFIVPFEILSMLVSGAWLNLSTLSIYFIWIKYTSPFFYTYEAVSIIQFTDYTNAECGTAAPSCYMNATSILQKSGFDVTNKWFYNIYYLILLSIVFCLIGYLGIINKRRKFVY